MDRDPLVGEVSEPTRRAWSGVASISRAHRDGEVGIRGRKKRGGVESLSVLDQHASRGEFGRSGKSVEVGVPEDSGVSQTPKQLRVIPRDIPSSGKRPHRERLVGCLRGYVFDVRDQTGVEPAGNLVLDSCEQAIDSLVVAVDRAVIVGREPELLAGRHHGDRRRRRGSSCPDSGSVQTHPGDSESDQGPAAESQTT